jgi:Protein of unknown function (DUF1549)/Protein of unknown function (DUF1553)/Planctomycete cytochrome C
MRTLLIVAIGPLLCVPGVSIAAVPDPRGVELFETKIRPVLIEQCYSCHSDEAAKGKKLKAGLKLDTADATRKGGDSGAGYVAGKPKESLIYQALLGDGVSQMPPKGKLPAAVIADFERWIALGAPDPRDGKSDAGKSTFDLAAAKTHWAFRAPALPAVPATDPKLPPIDAFIRAKLNEQGLTPSPEADKRVLIRRLSFDLVGLPPTPEEVDRFVNDASTDAYPKLIDRLLASPQYGERWARHWLDVARYAEDQAHTFAVKPKSNAYQYRDWVIRALNRDMPYDQFVKFQIAGDLMPESSGDAFTRLAGLGFLGLGAEYYKNTNAAQAIADELDDRIDTITRGFLALTVSCARCHDHKFDPIPTRDYYSIAGIFNGFQPADLPLAPVADVKAFDDAQKKVKEQDDAIKTWLNEKARVVAEVEGKRVAEYLAAVTGIAADRLAGKMPNLDAVAKDRKLEARFLKQWSKFLDPKNEAKMPAPLKPWFAMKGDEQSRFATGFQKTLTDAIAARKAKPTKEQSDLLKVLFVDGNAPFAMNPQEAEKMLPADDAATLTKLKGELETRKKASPAAYPVAHAIRGGGKEMKVFVRGNPAKQGEPAPKGFLQAVSFTTSAKDFNRLELANAIASKDNPLTARVIVNRVWAQHFGRGLVTTPSNFGKLGDKPTHPELLDWLTLRFIDNGWSIKWLHREILNTATYRQSGDSHAAQADKDGDNTYLWKMSRRRLEIEPWRDSLLSVSGRLDPALGGPTTNLRDANNSRRTIYGKVSRHELDGLLRIFDFPDANVTADKRTLTTVPQQQLFVLNSSFMLTQAKAFAARVLKLHSEETPRIEAAYRLAYGRKPTPSEVAVGREFLAQPARPDDKLSPWEQYAQALLGANEFLYVD